MSAEPQFDAQQEVRFAIVLYGGASLAIYLYGIAEELLHLVRATAPAASTPSGPKAGALAYPEAESTESVYRKLGQMLGPDGIGPAGGPVRTRFIVDVISGTSAGGINGVCLAKALANGTTVAGLKSLWLTDGDIAGLVNDDQSVYEPGPDGSPSTTPITDLHPGFTPVSLLNSDRMFVRLVSALGSMTAPDPDAVPPLVDELDLYVTATDLSGNRLATQLWNTTSWERRHANRFHFRRAPREGRDDFGRDDNSFLAFAARCTSAFPFAFTPMTLNHVGDFPSASPMEDWRGFYPDYVTGDFPTRSFSDGGILDNKPFSYATGALVGRRAPLPVDRKLIYVEPDPGDPPPVPLPPEPAREWNGLQTTQAALLKIPRVEGIRNDINAVLTRNRQIDRARDIVSLAATDPVEYAQVRSVALEQTTGEDWGALSLADTVRQRGWGPAYATYHRLKVRGIVDYLATLVVRAAPGFNPDSDDVLAVHYLVRAWKEAHYDERPGGGRRSENRLLLDFSLPYRWRRLSFVLKKLAQLTSNDPELARRALDGCGLTEMAALPDDPDAAQIVRDLRARLTAAADVLYAADRELAAPTGKLAPLLQKLGIGRKQLDLILDTSDDGEMLARAAAVVTNVAEGDFGDLTAVVSQAIDVASDASRELLSAPEALGPQTTEQSIDAATDLGSTLRYALRFYYDAFEAFDLLLFPLEFGTEIGETNAVEILRISPRECSRPAGIPESARELRGKAINHFGAFFDLEWRKHDMLWGRLNASETLIRSLLPPGHPELEPLIDEAHRLIVDSFAAERVPAVTGDAWDWFKTYDPPTAPEKPRTIAVLDRAAVVLGTVLGGILAQSKAAAGWTVLRSILRPNPGGWRAVWKTWRLLFLGTTVGQIATGVWLVLLLLGIGLLASGASAGAGIVLIVGMLVLAGCVVAALWIAIARIRAVLEQRVGVFVFGPPGGA
jgi:patatin-related protein